MSKQTYTIAQLNEIAFLSAINDEVTAYMNKVGTSSTPLAETIKAVIPSNINEIAEDAKMYCMEAVSAMDEKGFYAFVRNIYMGGFRMSLIEEGSVE